MGKPRFLQLHFLTAYSANNLNRDDASRPKSMVFGTTPRLRLASQCVKRAWRVSDVMQAALAGTEGVRSREQWYVLGQELVAAGYAEADVVAHLSAVREAFDGVRQVAEDAEDGEGEDGKKASKPKKASKSKKASKGAVATGLDSLKSDLFYFSHAELEFIRATVADSLNAAGSTAGKPADVSALKSQIQALPMSGDVAMFGRMVAANGALTIEGAMQVAHPFTVNKSLVDDDFFTAVDDLADGTGSAHLGANGFGSGLYYGYVNIDLPVLLRNLGGDVVKAKALLLALAEAVATVAPGGKQNSFAARSYASFLMAESGSAQPRAFADAFATPIRNEPLIETAIQALLKDRDSIQMAFPSQATNSAVINRIEGSGTFADIEKLISAALEG